MLKLYKIQRCYYFKTQEMCENVVKNCYLQ